MSDNKYFSFSVGVKTPSPFSGYSLRHEINIFSLEIKETITYSYGPIEVGTIGFRTPNDLSEISVFSKAGAIKVDVFSNLNRGAMIGASIDPFRGKAAVRAGAGTREVNAYLKAEVSFDKLVKDLLNSEFYQFPSFDPWDRPLHRVDEDGTPQYGPSYTAQRDDNNKPWGLDTPTERQGYQPGGAKSSFVSPNMSPNRLGGRTNQSRSDGSLSRSPEASPSQRSGAQDAAPGSNSGMTDTQRSSVWGGEAANSRGSRGSLANSPEASPSQRAGARANGSNSNSRGSSSSYSGITDTQRSSVRGGTAAPTSNSRGTAGSLANSPEASPSQMEVSKYLPVLRSL